MNINRTHSGYILVMSLMMIALVVFITAMMNETGSNYVPYMSAMIQRQRARILAEGGIAFAQSQLGVAVVAEQDQKNPQKKAAKPTEQQEATTLLKDIVPILNRWQHIDFTFEKDGFDGSVDFLITCEHGKLNINELFDFKEKKFKNEKKGEQSIKSLLTILLAPVEKRMKATELVTALETLLAKRGYPLNDITELLTDKNFSSFKHAQYNSTKKQVKSTEKTPPFILTDLFTTHTNTHEIEPWLLSDSVRRLCGIQPIDRTNAAPKEMVDSLPEILKKFRIKTDWTKEWDTLLKPSYTIQLSQLPKGFIQFCTKTFEPRIFSVIVSATVGENTQQLYAILERIKKSQDTKTLYEIYIRTFYWI